MLQVTNLQDLKLKEGELTFSAKRVVGDNKFHSAVV